MTTVRTMLTLDSIAEVPWALAPTYLARVTEWISRRGTTEEAQSIFELPERPQTPQARGGVAVIPIHGLIEHRSSLMAQLFGGSSLEDLRAAFRSAMADPSVGAIVLDVDSPGGSVAGTPELAAEILDARGGGKPIVAVVNTLAASAAYWIASQADEIVASPSSSSGGIGVYAVHQENSRQLDAEGITTTVVSAGPYKTEANDFTPLTDEAKAELQARADAFYGTFLGDVARGRGTTVAKVRADFGEGRIMLAKPALAAGMVDRIGTLDQTLIRLARSTARSAPRKMAATTVELFLALDHMHNVSTSAAPATTTFLIAGPPAEEQSGAVAAHGGAAEDGEWDGGANEGNLPSPMPVATARKVYAWIDSAAVEDDEVPKSGTKFIHHFVDSEGVPGAASQVACSSGIGVVNGGRGGTSIPAADRRGVYDHLAAHLRAADLEPPEYRGDLPFADHVAATAEEILGLAEHASERARLRGKEGRTPFSDTTQEALRTSRDAISALLEPDDPAPLAGPPPAVDPPAPPAAKPVSTRHLSDSEWLAHLKEHAR